MSGYSQSGYGQSPDMPGPANGMPDYSQVPNDPGFQYGGYGSGYLDTRNRLEWLQSHVQAPDWTQTWSDYNSDQKTRAQQAQLVAQLQAQMNSNAPTAADYGRQSAMDQAIAQQMGAGANGPGSLAAATLAQQQGVAAANSGMGQYATQNLGEHLAANNAYAQALAGMRGGDLGSRALLGQQAQAQAQIMSQQQENYLADELGLNATEQNTVNAYLNQQQQQEQFQKQMQQQYLGAGSTAAGALLAAAAA